LILNKFKNEQKLLQEENLRILKDSIDMKDEMLKMLQDIEAKYVATRLEEMRAYER
jgi:hypothetical protein